MARMRKDGREEIFLAAFLILSLPGILSATSSFTKFSGGAENVGGLNKSTSLGMTGPCAHGFGTEADICECNPCWSGPTCQDYVDRFSPRFLAEEPFFILNYEAWQRQTSSKFGTPPVGGDDVGGTASPTSIDRSESPLFRIEASDDDLGLTCQLGEVGPSATCPCATPRYSVIGQSSETFYADPETGDIFLRNGRILEAGKQYFITLQVSALKVKDAVQEDWKEEIRARLFVRAEEERTTAEVTKILLDYLKFSDAEFEKDAEENSALSPEEAQSLYTAHYLPRASDLHSSSTFRYKRQIRRRKKRQGREDGGDSKIQISFDSGQMRWESFHDEDRIKVGIRIQLPAVALRPNFGIEVSIKDQVEGHRIGIHSGNITKGISLMVKAPTPSYTFLNDIDTRIADSVTWNFENIKPTTFGFKPRERRKPDEIHLAVTLSAPTQHHSLPNFDDLPITRNLGIRNLTVAAQISFPLEQSQNRNIQTVIQFPIRRNRSKSHAVGSGRRKGRKLSRPLDSFETQEDGAELDERPRLEVVGPAEIPRGSSGSYIIRLPVKVDLTRELTLSLYQIGNLTQGPISVSDLQVIRAGRKFSGAHQTSKGLLPHGVHLECTNYSSVGEAHASEGRGQPPLEGCILHVKSLNFLHRERPSVLEFAGIIQSLPEAPVGSTFLLQAEAAVNEESRQELMMVMTGPSRPATHQRVDKSSPTTRATVTVIGRIVESSDGEGRKGAGLGRLDPDDLKSSRKRLLSFPLHPTGQSPLKQT